MLTTLAAVGIAFLHALPSAAPFAYLLVVVLRRLDSHASGLAMARAELAGFEGRLAERVAALEGRLTPAAPGPPPPPEPLALPDATTARLATPRLGVPEAAANGDLFLRAVYEADRG